MKFKAQVDMKSKYGNRHTQVREFNSDSHLDNYVSQMESRGHKVLGIIKLKPIESHESGN